MQQRKDNISVFHRHKGLSGTFSDVIVKQCKTLYNTPLFVSLRFQAFQYKQTTQMELKL